MSIGVQKITAVDPPISLILQTCSWAEHISSFVQLYIYINMCLIQKRFLKNKNLQRTTGSPFIVVGYSMNQSSAVQILQHRVPFEFTVLQQWWLQLTIESTLLLTVVVISVTLSRMVIHCVIKTVMTSLALPSMPE